HLLAEGDQGAAQRDLAQVAVAACAGLGQGALFRSADRGAGGGRLASHPDRGEQGRRQRGGDHPGGLAHPKPSSRAAGYRGSVNGCSIPGCDSAPSGARVVFAPPRARASRLLRRSSSLCSVESNVRIVSASWCFSAATSLRSAWIVATRFASS